ncbi:biotin transporter BioY [Desertihabitans brevis]|uniref:Biotin transporter n=1 Tax=Desertihabitans brevis TaxID=2268447 RepID=A0A367YYJ8_9ACTN|nr:biotin transporter BioY [Desertihabitans brevis]RCK70966.1 biotin transporter BioY [Desertihabitans brevis]
MPAPRRLSGADLALVAGFAALVAVCALLPAIRFGPSPVPITLQTFAVVLAGAVLGPRRGFLAVLLYLVVGAVGLPVFSGGAAGVGVFAGPTAGYLVSFPAAALVTGLVVRRLPLRRLSTSVPLVLLAALAGSLVTHVLGIAGLALRADLGLAQAFAVDVVFWPGDLLKCLAVALVATAVHRAFPDLLARPRSTRDADAVPA